MNIERFLNKAEDFLEFSVNRVNEKIFFEPPITVGTSRVVDAFPDRKYFPGFDMVILDVGGLTEMDSSAIIFRVPKNLIKGEQIAEIVIKKSKFKGEPEVWLTAIRPFDKLLYGKPIEWSGPEISSMFSSNQKDSSDSKRFFKKFIETRLRKEPPFTL